MQPLIDTQEFLALSSFLNYQLSGEPVNWHGILNLMAGKKVLPEDAELLLDTLSYLGDAYGGQKRRLGPLAVLHPIRAAALFARVVERPSAIDLLSTLLHDKNEDLTEELYSEEDWQKLQERFHSLVTRVERHNGYDLEKRIGLLTKFPGQKYHHYLGTLLGMARDIPALASIKLADRLDNTLDLRIDLHDFTDHSRCYQILFDMIFLKTYQGFKSEEPHPISRKINGAMRLYQLYKNAVFLSILRHKKVVLDDDGERMFFSLAVASIREAQTILLHIFAYHMPDPVVQRRLVIDSMEYSQDGGFERISSKGGHPLDGLFKSTFEFENKKMKKQGLADLYRNKELMGRSALGFLIIFANFLNDRDFLIKGISDEAIVVQQDSYSKRGKP